MIRLIIRTVVYLVSAAIGLLVASAVLDDFNLHAAGFLVAVVVFSAAQLILGPFIFKVVRNNAEAFVGGVGLVSTFVALLIASFVGDGLDITGASTWIAGTVIVWLVTAIATMLLPFLLAKAGVKHAREEKEQTAG
ncbi:phage holin family protein [Gordonia sp. ABSL49_1]|uniref:phage holin family protein n=1 Tax=Gordonia sp. ABSL49_1 TaxID=2920941 RepID=UPI001F0D0C36|nr:phage holin family protein [Gordonia sp. ABSL49_1]MCH5644472.1 phage holin family protein [Gordonia sp. ABSL49_1]